MRVGWQTIPFDEAIEDVSGGNIKTPQSEFLKDGEFAVVDQGKELIAGFVNDRRRLCRSQLPVVVFGDHTRCFKYVDFPFCIGADGVKVLRPRVAAEVKYLYHFLRQLRLPDGGYDRHFKYLKRANIVLPPLEEQWRIAEVLDRAKALRAKRCAALNQLDCLIQSMFLELFGDPATNLKGWPALKLHDLADKITDGEHQTPKRTTHGIRLLSARNIRDGFIDTTDVDYVSDEEHERIARRCNPELGDVLISCSGTIGRVAKVSTSEPLSLVRSVALIKPKREIVDSSFLEHYLRTPALRRKMLRSANASSQANLFQGQIRDLPAILPPIVLQQQFARQIAAVEKLKAVQRASLAEMDALFASLQHRAFSGQL